MNEAFSPTCAEATNIVLIEHADSPTQAFSDDGTDGRGSLASGKNPPVTAACVS